MNGTNIDSYNMKQMIEDFPKQFPVGYGAVGDSGKELANIDIKNIIIAGMGGSALPGELLSLLSDTLGLKVPVSIHRDYGAAPKTSKESLVVAISYSGNTEETLSAYQGSKELGASMAVITSNGSLGQMAKNDDAPLALVPEGMPPRLAIGYQFAALLGILANTGIIEPKDKEMEQISSGVKAAENMSPAKELANAIGEKTPLVYSSSRNKALSYILKIQMNENAKRIALCNVFPELNHNELAGYENSDSERFFVVMLRDEQDDPRVQKRMQEMAKVIEGRDYAVKFVDINGENMYNRAFNTVLFGNWLSYYLAIQDEIDPTPVDIIEEFKKSLK